MKKSSGKNKTEVIPLFFDTYLTSIKNSIGTKLFQTVWAEVNGKKKDVIRKGELACATFVSGILYQYDLIGDKHATVKKTVADLEKTGWKKISKPRPGCILVWESLEFEDGPHAHIGFYTGNNKAISNSRRLGTPHEHHWTYGKKKGKPTRRVDQMYWFKKLDSKYFE